MIPLFFKSHPAFDAQNQDIVLPANLETKAKLLAFLHRAVPLPDYFGHNWDALSECLGKLDWLDRPGLVLVHQDIPLRNSPFDQKIYLQLLAQAAMETNRLTVVFPEDCRSDVTYLLKSTKAP